MLPLGICCFRRCSCCLGLAVRLLLGGRQAASFCDAVQSCRHTGGERAFRNTLGAWASIAGEFPGCIYLQEHKLLCQKADCKAWSSWKAPKARRNGLNVRTLQALAGHVQGLALLP